MRPVPPPPPAVIPQRSGERVERDLRYAVITPLFGGGVRPREADPVQIVRGSAIRGQLRFWWRAARGGQFNDNLRAMKQVEDEIWGAASTPTRPSPSQVQIRVTVRHGGQARLVEELPKLGYGTFPFSEEIKQGDQPVLYEGIFFDLHIAFRAVSQEERNYQAEIDAALWAWTTFGGIGGRTRRGFGAIASATGDTVAPGHFSPNPKNAEAALRTELDQYVTPGVWPDGVPNLGAGVQFKFRTPKPTAQQVQEDLLDRLKLFRQDRGPTRRARNSWPEPDAIRRLQPNPKRKHQPISKVDKFPRAAFGLPIIFHFKPSDNDPSDTTLQGSNGERLASPLILRPLPAANGQFLGLALLLADHRLPPGGLVLSDGHGSTPVDSVINAAEQAQVALLKNQPDPLLAFLDTL